MKRNIEDCAEDTMRLFICTYARGRCFYYGIPPGVFDPDLALC